jgi:hypothetical protein
MCVYESMKHMMDLTCAATSAAAPSDREERHTPLGRYEIATGDSYTMEQRDSK